MKHNALRTVTVSLLAVLLFQAFQCGSPEFTGAKVYIQQKNYAEAIKLLVIETRNNPKNEEAWYLLGEMYYEQGDYINMNTAFNKAIELSDKHVSRVRELRFKKWADHLNKGVDFLQKGSEDSTQYFDMAVEQFTRASEAWPDTMLTYRYLGYAYSNKGDDDKALEAYMIAWEKGKDTDSYKRVGRIYLRRGKALKQEFMDSNQTKIDALRNLGSVEKRLPKGDVMRLLGPPTSKKEGGRRSSKDTWTYATYKLEIVFDHDKVESIKKTGEYMPNIDSTDHRAALAEFDKAVEVFEDVKKIDPKDNENLNLLLDAYVQSDRIEEAAAAFSLAIENEPNNKLNHYILGILNRTLGKFDEAITSFKKALEIDPEYSDALFDIGATYYNWGVDMIKEAMEAGSDSQEFKTKFRDALPYLEKVAGMRNDDPSVWETLGTIYARLGQADKAMKALDRADQIRKGN